ncbi:MAG: hypothetical protein ISR61_03495 [Desulfobacteraceae bacterium]|uniref:Uncharacterized protein n=1 Tax=Candidatus Desulfacyla euxinica TaxID=2841693 RepID=A0A8J6MZX7_9DELT|nr:hypothetical protein [Candidatus Desulfacyla euxinica]MBL6977987.1 hypothetical protein [Desulfobacteraceae bacterium]
MKTAELRKELEAKESDDRLRTDALISKILDMETIDRWKVERFVNSLGK